MRSVLDVILLRRAEEQMRTAHIPGPKEASSRKQEPVDRLARQTLLRVLERTRFGLTMREIHAQLDDDGFRVKFQTLERAVCRAVEDGVVEKVGVSEVGGKFSKGLERYAIRRTHG